MPFYHQLRVRESDSAALKEKKKRTALRLQRLKAALAKHVQNSNWRMATKQSIRIATWNLREFGSGKYKGRDIEALHYIAEIISHFDIVALQEVRGDLQEFNNLLRILGPDWDYLGTDVTDGSPGNGERMIFVYDKRSIRFRNIVGELTLEEGQKIRAAFGERIKLEHAGMKVVLPPRSRSLSGVYDASLRTVSKGKKLADDLEIPLPEGTMLELPPGSSIVLTKNTLVDSPGRGDAEVEIPNEISGENWRLRLPENSFDDSLKQFARTPFLISFQAGWLKINLCTVHIYYGSNSSAEMEQRRSEIFQLSKALADKAKKEFKYDGSSFLGVLGDFNIIGKGHPTMEALESNGFVIPDQLKAIPGSNVARDKAYDQIAFWEPNQDRGILSLDILAANVFDFFEHVFTDEDEAIYREEAGNGMEENTRYSNWRTYKMSDHLPMWIEIRTDFSEDYLEAIEPEQEKLINKQLDGGLDEA